MSEQVADAGSGSPSSGSPIRNGEPAGELLLSWTLRPGGAVLVEADGVLDAVSSPRFADLVRDRLADTRRGLVLDLSRLSFLDTHGVVVLTEAAHRAHVRGVELVLVSGNRIVDRLLSVLELDGWFRRAPSGSALDGAAGSGGRRESSEPGAPDWDRGELPIPRQATGPAVHPEL